MNDVSIKVNGKIVTGLQWGDPTKPVLLAVHGWLDNAASFVPLANAIFDDFDDGSLGYQLIAIDLPGHGYSEHKVGHYNFIEWVDDLYQIIKTQQWGSVSIIGHSMGAMIASIFTATFPELVEKVVLVEGLGAISSRPDETVSQLRKGIESRALYNQGSNQSMDRKTNTLTLEKVVKARCYVSDLNETNATLLCKRNLIVDEKGMSWRSDPRLKSASLVRLTELQVIDVLSNISTRCLIIIGDKGFAKISETLTLALFRQDNFSVIKAVGGHHIHMDNPAETASAVVKFIKN